MPFPDIALDRIGTTGILAAKLWVPGGSSADPSAKRGAHQLLGSLLTRGCERLDHQEMADLVEGCGAALRCETHEDELLITLKCAVEDAPQLLPLLGWMLRCPKLDQAQVALERDLSLQALERLQEDPFHLAFDGWRKLAFGDGPYGHDPLGLTEDLERISRKDLVPLARALPLQQGILALAGDLSLDPASLLKQSPAFEEWPTEDHNCSAVAILPEGSQKESANPQRLSLQLQSTGQVVFILGQPTLCQGTEDDLALRLLQCHLGAGMSSLLFRRLREDHGVAYDVGVHYLTRLGPSPFLFHASSAIEKGPLALQLLLDCWHKMAYQPLEDQELDLARAKFRGHIAHARQTCSQRAERLVHLRGLGLPDDFDTRCLKLLPSVTSADLQAAAYQHLNRPLLSLCGPEKCLETLGQQWYQSIT
ncbi:insulinase family protein [cyanobiont of Ornithocercus magnificus]|nr:insulinase family protein [cyanobiont of Ornithocercus magnificus]